MQDVGSVKAVSRQLADRILAHRHAFSDVHPTAFPCGRAWQKCLWSIFRDLMVIQAGVFGVVPSCFFDFYIIVNEDHFFSVFKSGLFAIGLSGFLVVAGVLLELFYAPALPLLTLLLLALLTFSLGLGLVGWSLSMPLLIRIYKQNIGATSAFVREEIAAKPDRLPQA